MRLQEDLHGVDIESKIADIETKYHDTVIKANQAKNKSQFENSE